MHLTAHSNWQRILPLNPTADCKLCVFKTHSVAAELKGRFPFRLATKMLPHSRDNAVHLFFLTASGTFPKTATTLENAPFELLLTVCLAQISLLFCLFISAILFIYRINRMHCKAIIHLLCSETTLHHRVSSHCAWVRCRAAGHRCWCDGFSLHSHVHSYSFQDLPNPKHHLTQKHLSTESHIS